MEGSTRQHKREEPEGAYGRPSSRSMLDILRKDVVVVILGGNRPAQYPASNSTARKRAEATVDQESTDAPVGAPSPLPEGSDEPISLVDTHVLSDEDALTYLKLGVTPNELVRLRWPDASDDEAGFILWEMTPFPIVSGVHDIVDAVAEVPERPERPEP